MKLERTLRKTTELGLALSFIAVSTLAGCLNGGIGVTNASTSSSVNLREMGGAIQGGPLSLTTAVSTVAGASAGLSYPLGIATDGTNLYLADSFNNEIRKIVISSGAMTVLAGAGSSMAGSTDNTGTLAQFWQPTDITTDGTNLFVVDSANQTIRKIVISSGAVTTLAGVVGTSGVADTASGIPATFYYPYGITTDGINLYVTDSYNNTIRKIVISSGTVTTLAGIAGTSGSTDTASGVPATFNYPTGISTDGTYLYVADTFNNKIRKVTISSGAVVTLAGKGNIGATDNTIGTLATFFEPHGITTDGTNLYIADGNSEIRKIVISSGAVTTLAGSFPFTGTADNASGVLATFNNPHGITTDGVSLYVSDSSNNLIRKVQ